MKAKTYPADEIIGKTVTARRTSGRRFRLTVTHEMTEGDVQLLVGLIPSRKHPGDFIGNGSTFSSLVESIES